MEEPKSSSLIGETFGNYTASVLLGQGSMGSVYLGVHPEIDLQVAIKVLANDLALHPAMEERFVKEARAISAIKHPNVIDIYDFGHLPGGRPYYIMEHLHGAPLSREMARGPLTVEETLRHTRQICAGLQALHDQGVVHRDLKPENIFVEDGAPPTLKLLDFGLVKVMSSGTNQTHQGAVVGTPVVIAPEQAAGKSESICPQTDLYSLGVIMFWMLTGRPPFDDEATGILLARHMRDPAPDPREFAPDIPARVAALIARCLEKDPADRPASAAALAKEFGGAASEPTLEGPTGPRAVSLPPAADLASRRTLPSPVEQDSSPGASMFDSLLSLPLSRWSKPKIAAVVVVAATCVLAVFLLRPDRPSGAVTMAKSAGPDAGAHAPLRLPDAGRAAPVDAATGRPGDTGRAAIGSRDATATRRQPRPHGHGSRRRPARDRDARVLAAAPDMDEALPPPPPLPSPDARAPTPTPTPPKAGEGTLDPYAAPR